MLTKSDKWLIGLTISIAVLVIIGSAIAGRMLANV